MQGLQEAMWPKAVSEGRRSNSHRLLNQSVTADPSASGGGRVCSLSHEGMRRFLGRAVKHSYFLSLPLVIVRHLLGDRDRQRQAFILIQSPLRNTLTCTGTGKATVIKIQRKGRKFHSSRRAGACSESIQVSWNMRAGRLLRG